MSENVNYHGKSKAEAGDGYNWRSEGPRLTVLMRGYIPTRWKSTQRLRSPT